MDVICGFVNKIVAITPDVIFFFLSLKYLFFIFPMKICFVGILQNCFEDVIPVSEYHNKTKYWNRQA